MKCVVISLIVVDASDKLIIFVALFRYFMVSKTSAIVLHVTPYSDVASILAVYSLENGRCAYFVRGSKKRRSPFKNAFFQPLSLVEMDVIHQQGKTIHQIRDVHMIHPLVNLSSHPIKNAIALFIAELLYKTLRNEESQPMLYSFLENSILQLDLCEEGIPNFHLVFMVKLSRYLGFEASPNQEGCKYFDLQHGIFTNSCPPSHYIQPDVCATFSDLLERGYHDAHLLVLSRTRRVELLGALMEFYQLQIPEFKGLQSLSVLQSLFD